MGLRVQTQAAMLRTQRQQAESQSLPPENLQLTKKLVKATKADNWPDASDTRLSENLRAELRSVGEARLAALADMTAIEQHDCDVRTADDALAKLRSLASLHLNSSDQDDGNEHSLQYQVLQDQIQRAVISRADIERSQAVSPENVVIGEDYFQETKVPRLDTQPVGAISPALTERALSQLDEYKSYLKAIQKRLVSRFDRLATKTRQLCETEKAIDTDSFACDVATFTQQRILNCADLSLRSHEGLVPKVALSLITP